MEIVPVLQHKTRGMAQFVMFFIWCGFAESKECIEMICGNENSNDI